MLSERIAEIVRGTYAMQHADDLLIGASTKQELVRKLLCLFERLKEYGFKVNFDKDDLLVTSITFLGVEIEQGHWSLKKYLENKVESRIRHPLQRHREDNRNPVICPKNNSFRRKPISATTKSTN